ncbi:MAG TPA: hypothetical protein VFO21_06310 [Vicinamibacterales bacterium]|nr:hypothetical protein [Vicinamibacterales bacterium]
MRRVLFLAISSLLVTAGTALAQNAYVGATLTGEIVRTTHVEAGTNDTRGSGEAIGFALRVGTALGSSWGVELEYARPSVIKRQEELFYPLPVSMVPERALGAIPGVVPDIYPPIFPIPLAIETRDRHSAVSAVLWANQRVSDRVALVYLGGVAFSRFEREYGYASDGPIILFPVSRTIRYGAHPVVGFESWIGLTDRVTLMPGVRMRAVEDGWSIRPAVGIGWSF